MICVISRATTAGTPDHLLTARAFCERAWRRIRRNLRQVEANSDPDTTAIARLALDPGRYPFE